MAIGLAEGATLIANDADHGCHPYAVRLGRAVAYG